MIKRGGWRICGVLLLLFLFGCQETKQNAEHTPTSVPTAATITEHPSEELAEVVEAYVSHWQQGDYASMFALLTPASRSDMTEPQFADRYKTLYEKIDAENIIITALPDKSMKSQNAAVNASVRGFDYRVRMDSVAGPIEFEQHGRARKTQDGSRTEWRIEWEPSLIFPKLQEGDTIRVQAVIGERGELLDRSGAGLAVNGSAPQLGIVPGRLGENAEGVKQRIADQLGITFQEIDRKLGASWVRPDLFVPIALVDEGSEETFRDIPGVLIQEKKLRVYPLGEAAAHLTGYVGEITAEELEKRKDKGYAVGDEIGKSGLEQVLEDELKGTDGVVATIVDKVGNRKAVLAEQPAVPGKTFKLTIDADLQKTIYDEIKADASSVSAIDPQTGEVTALVSTPSYDPNAFVRGISKDRYQAWSQDPRHPFLNRFTQSYSPGSTFKLVTAAIGLDTHTLDPDEAKPITGLTWAKDKSWGKYYVKRVHAVSPVDLSTALLYSDNIYFAQAALQIGKTKFAEGAAGFGIGEQLPVLYPFTRSQLANRGIGSDIQLADTGYGQGQVAVTTLQLALIYSALVHDGDIVYPKLERAAVVPKAWKERAMSPETAARLKEDLIQAVRHPDGVGHGAYIEGAAIAGKTGTAELKAAKDAEGKENGWFVGFDANRPKLLLSVMVEDVGKRGGSGYVAPIVKRIFEKFEKEE